MADLNNPNFGMLQGAPTPGIHNQSFSNPGTDNGLLQAGMKMAGDILGSNGLLGQIFGKTPSSTNTQSAQASQIRPNQAQGPTQAQPNAMIPTPGIQQAPSSIQNPGQQTSQMMGMATPMISQFEGYQAKPTWDVNAYRAGYGSDTTTLPNGQVQKIQPGMQVNQADAQRDLARRIPQFANTAAGQIGQDVWNKLPPHAQAGLTSVAYNYGSLPKNVVMAAKSGDISQIADAVRSRAQDNKNVNFKRRHMEADYIENGYNQDNA